MNENTEQPEAEPDEIEFRHWRQWRKLDDFDVERDYAELICTRGSQTLPIARRRHDTDLAGGWITEGMIAPHVSALRVFESGRILREELAPCRDVHLPSRQQSMV